MATVQTRECPSFSQVEKLKQPLSEERIAIALSFLFTKFDELDKNNSLTFICSMQ